MSKKEHKLRKRRCSYDSDAKAAQKTGFVLTLLLCLGLCLLTACGGQEQAPAPEQTPDAAALTVPEITGAMAEGPILLTSMGQSADVNVAQTLFKKAEIDCDMNAMAGVDVLANHQTLVLVVGDSSKGLGAAGVNEELARADELIAAAQEQGMTIIAMHIGGSARRGTLSGRFIPAPLQAAAAIIISEGDSDDLMRGLLAENQTPTTFVADQISALDPIKTLFGK